ncbi:MAG: salt tolerance down-regulator-domain-containing protein [Linnemannia gamsii]|nr:MAG: salt tolerance down-regulator-domain-containing protein [Linnemannia gamsii]
MAAHTFAPEDALPPPKSAVIYSRDGRKRSLNIDMTKHFAPSLHDHSMPPPHPANASAGTTPAVTVRDASSSSSETPHSHKGASSSSNHSGLLFGSINASHKKKKKKRSKKKALERIEESEQRTGGPRHHQHQHHADCQHDHPHHHHHDSGHHHHDDEDEDDEDFYSDEEVYEPETPSMVSASGAGAVSAEGSSHQDASIAAASTSQTIGSTASKKKKKKKKKTTNPNSSPSFVSNSFSQHNHNHNHSHLNNSKAMVPTGHRNGHEHGSMVKHSHDNHTQNDGFWHYSDAEERQRIREFWFQLREEERRSLVRVEKEAVLKKMKEQQRHSCSCSLCGRKRTAIEEELELLYDAYYDELEQYANQQQPSEGHVLTYAQHAPAFEDDELSDESRGSDEEDDEDDEDDDDDEDEDDEDDDEEEDDEYEDEDDEEEYEDEISNRQAPFPYRSGFPNTLQAKGNILTVAEDLLENDGKKFLEMMDRLADRKVQRDDDLMDNRGVYEEYDDEDDGEFEDDGPEEDALTKEQRMEEGRRMFQAFAARMFEQRVLSAYREKVAQERQERLLAELEEESRQEQLREEKKEREKEKKRDKKRLQRQQKEEERAAKEAQRLAEEKRVQEERERKQEADRKRREEERRAKEEEKRLREEERIKKEEERKRKAKEEKAREAEKERRRREEQLAKEKEDQLAKDKEERLVKETEEQLAKEKEEQAKKAEEDARRQEREAYLKQQLALEQLRQEELRLQEQLAKQELALELELQQEEERQRQTLAITADASIAPITSSAQDTTSQSSSLESSTTLAASTELTSALDEPRNRSPKVSSSLLPNGIGESLNDMPTLTQGPSTSVHNPLWSNSYPGQSNPQAHVQSQHSLAHQHSMFQQPVQQGLFQPPTHFGPIGGEHDAFSSRLGHSAGRGGGFLSGPSHPNLPPFQVAPQHSSSSNQSMGGLRSPGLGSIGYGQGSTSGKQMMTLMSTNSSGTHDLSNKSGSPLHSPSGLGAIGTPINAFGPISPIGHARRTSTPHGLTADAIKPIQRPVPIGRPKDSAHNTGSAKISSSFDGLTLGLSGLAVGAELERRSKSPPLNLTGGPSLDLDGVVIGNKDSLRSTNAGSESHSFSNDPIVSTGLRQLDPPEPLQSLSPSNPGSFFTNSFFGSRMNGHAPFMPTGDFSTYGQQQPGHGSGPSAAHFMSPYAMNISSPPQIQLHHLQQHQRTSQQQQLYLQQQQQQHYIQELQLQQQQQHQLQQHQLQQQQQHQLGLGSPPLNGSNTWGRTNFMRPPHMNGVGASVSSTMGMSSPPSRALSPPPALSNGGNVSNGPHSPLMPIGPPNGGAGNHMHQQHPSHTFNHFPSHGLGLSVGSGRKSVSHMPTMRMHGGMDGIDASLLSPRNNSVSGIGQAMDSERLPNGFSSGFGTHLLQQKQQQQQQQQQQLQQLQQQQQQQQHPIHHQLHQPHPLGSIGEAEGPTGGGAAGGGGAGAPRETTYSL